GTHWPEIPAPSPREGPVLRAVSAISPTDAWAVGDTGPAARQRAFAEHWDGSTWSLFILPNTPDEHNYGWDVKALAPDEAWIAAGRTYGGSLGDTVMERWDGADWTAVSTADHAGVNSLTHLAVVSSDDIWAAGTTFFSSYERPDASGSLHWDGSSW